MQNFLFRHNIKDKVIAFGVSGGADSLALVLMAKEQLEVYGYKIVALTVDHGLREKSAVEAQYVAEVMQKYGIEHHILKWIGEKPNTAVEETARIMRYNLLREWCFNNNVKVLMTAHHAQDQAETFLMRIGRGSGLDGLCCIREMSKFNGLVILRPLLNNMPEDMRNYLHNHHVAWMEDESNDDTRYLRNKIRRFLPTLAEQLNIDVYKIVQTVKCLQNAEDYIETQLDEILKNQVLVDFEAVYSFKYTDYLQWHSEMKFRVLAHLCRRFYIPRAERVLSVISKLDKLPFSGVTLGNKEIFLSYGRVWVAPEIGAKRKTSRVEWKDFIASYPTYVKKRIPHKARVAILEQWKKQ